MNNLEHFVAGLSDLEKQQIITDYETFNRLGAIGDCALRQRAGEFAGRLGVSGISITEWMLRLVNEVFRYFAYRYLRGLDDGK